MMVTVPEEPVVRKKQVSILGFDENEEIDRPSIHSHKSIRVGKHNTASSARESMMKKSKGFVIWPWNKKYRAWWGLTVACAVVTVFTETYGIAFDPAGMYPYDDPLAILEYFLVSIFSLDILINFNLVYYDENDRLISNKKAIAKHYFGGMFWFDFAGIFPFYAVALAISGQMGEDNKTTAYLSLLRLVKLVRLHRMFELFEILQYNPHVSLMWLTLVRNLSFALVWSHFSACVFFFIARMSNFDDNTWIGSAEADMSESQRYITSLYWSVVTFTTVGYGDYSPVNSAEKIWGIIYMLLNMIVAAWMIGSITLLIVKNDEKTGMFRDSLQTLKLYSTVHNFPRKVQKSLRTQLKLDFNNREISDESVLANFPSETRRKVLRRLYLPSLIQTKLMNGIRQQFVDAFLTTCRVEIFSPGEEIIERGSITSELYLLVVGTVKTVTGKDQTAEDLHERASRMSTFGGTSVADSESGAYKTRSTEIEAGEFINEIGFFTESPELETIQTVTVCKVLTMSKSGYKMIAEDHPGSVGKLLQNLLEKVQQMASDNKMKEGVNLPVPLPVLLAGSVFGERVRNTSNYSADGNDDNSSNYREIQSTIASIHSEAALTSIQELVKMHMNKQKDDQTTRFLFAASRGDASTICLMCDQGFDPNTSDYDNRTALMVAAMKGNTDIVEKLLEYSANPNVVDFHGTSALYEAVRNGHDETLDILVKRGATLGMNEGRAASTLCQAVFDGDILALRRLLRAGIPVNSGDYDKRNAAHIAAAEGNIACLKVLVEFNADLTLQDRWGNTVVDEAKRMQWGKLLEYLEEIRTETKNEFSA